MAIALLATFQDRWLARETMTSHMGIDYPVASPAIPALGGVESLVEHPGRRPHRGSAARPGLDVLVGQVGQLGDGWAASPVTPTAAGRRVVRRPRGSPPRGVSPTSVDRSVPAGTRRTPCRWLRR